EVIRLRFGGLRVLAEPISELELHGSRSSEVEHTAPTWRSLYLWCTWQVNVHPVERKPRHLNATTCPDGMSLSWPCKPWQGIAWNSGKRPGGCGVVICRANANLAGGLAGAAGAVHARGAGHRANAGGPPQRSLGGACVGTSHSLPRGHCALGGSKSRRRAKP